MTDKNTLTTPVKLGEEVLRVFFMDGSYKAIRINPLTSTVEDLWAIVASKINLPEKSAHLFFLWGVNEDFEILLFTQPRIQDVRKDWPKYLARYNPQEKGLVRSISMRFRPTPSESGATIRPSKSGSSLHLNSMVSETEETDFQFVFRTTAIIPLADEKSATDQASINLFYVQAVANVIESNYPCDIDMAVRLGGIQLQLTLGNRNMEIHKIGYLESSGILAKYVPEHLLKDLKPEEWETKLFAAHITHANKEGYALRTHYLDLVRNWIYYGSTFFKARYTQNDTFYKSEFEGKIRVGINENGIHLIDPKLMKVVTYSWNEISHWDSQKSIFFFEAKEVEKGSIFKIKKKASKFYQFKSPQAELINDFMCDWAEAIGLGEEEINFRRSKKFNA